MATDQFLAERVRAAHNLVHPYYRVVPADVPHSCSFGDVDEPCGVCGTELPEWERELLKRQDEPVGPAVEREMRSQLVGQLNADREIETMRTAVEQLAELDDEARRRVVRWLARRYLGGTDA